MSEEVVFVNDLGKTQTFIVTDFKITYQAAPSGTWSWPNPTNNPDFTIVDSTAIAIDPDVLALPTPTAKEAS